MRSRMTRDLAERALVRLALAVGDRVDSLTVIGGLNADLLTTPLPDTPHQGTVDVDVLLRLELVIDRDEQDFAWLEHAFAVLPIRPSRTGRAWQWEMLVDGVPVRLDLLCDVPDRRGQEVALPGTRDVTAMNIEGPAPAQSDVIERVLTVEAGDLPGTDGGPASVRLRFAGLGGYLHAKAAAVVGRGEDRDYYDLGFVLLHNRQGGPRPAAAAAFGALPAVPFSDHAGTFRAALRRLADVDGTAPWAYAAQRRRDGEGDDDDAEARIAQDVIAAAGQCLERFDALMSDIERGS